MKKTKIVATIGPASESEEVLRTLFAEGLNVCRLNFSHGTHDEHKARIKTIKKVREEMGLPIAIMLDTKGPEIRLGNFDREEGYDLEIDDYFTLTTRDVIGTRDICSISYKGLPEDVVEGNRILIDDGLVEMQVERIENGTDIVCKLLNYGTVKNHKGVNVPHVKIQLPALTERDIDDIKFGIENGIDFIAASFIRKADDVTEIRKILEENNGSSIEIISKIENQEGVDNMDEILLVSDGIMVARGDLGVEIQTELIPLVQKTLISKCNACGKPVITATQMLDSMTRNPRPTRAEVTDVANAILDGSSAIMLSGETAAGKYPVNAVKMMSRIAVTTEDSLDYAKLFGQRSSNIEVTTTNAIARATCSTAMDLQAAAIVTATTSGSTSRAISKFKPKAPIVAVTTSERVRRSLALSWGVYPILAPIVADTDEVLESAVDAALQAGYVNQGDLIVLTAGVPVGLAGSTNLIKVQTIGKVLIKARGMGSGNVYGRVTVANRIEELLSKFEEGDIVVCNATDKDMMKLLERASAIIAEEGGLTSHAAIVGLNLGKPTIVGATDATSILKDGDMITVDASTGLVYRGKATI